MRTVVVAHIDTQPRGAPHFSTGSPPPDLDLNRTCAGAEPLRSCALVHDLGGNISALGKVSMVAVPPPTVLGACVCMGCSDLT